MNRPLTWKLTITAAALSALTACGGDDKPATPAETDTSAGDTSTATDTTAADTTATDTTATDTAAPAFDCPGYCDPFDGCSTDVDMKLCVSLCESPDTAKAAQTCLTTIADCDSFIDCMLATKIPKAAPTRTFDEGPTGIKYRDLAGDFTVPTDKGDWNFKANYDGNDSYLFVFTGKGWYKGQDGTDYGMKLHDDATGGDLKNLLDWCPKNVHIFFIGYKDQTGADNSQTYVTTFAKKIEGVLANMTPVDRGWWKQRIHYVTSPAPIANEPITVPKTLGGWLGQFTQKRAPRVLAIDRYQRVRQIGLMGLVGQKKWFIQFLAFEAQYYDYEVKRAKDYPTEGVKTLTLLDNKVHKEPFLELELPSAEEMKGYDTLEIDHAQMCKDHDYQNCFEWDYLAWLKLVERPEKEDNPYAKETCTMAVKEVKAQAEVLGKCDAGANKDKGCKAGADCPDGDCKGYKKEIKAVALVVGDTKACTCITPRQEKVSREHVCGWATAPKGEKMGKCDGGADKDKACKIDGDCAGATCAGYQAEVKGVTGYKACGCKNVEMDVQRWVTTYNREGRWINDASHNLYQFANGGKVRFRYKPAYPYISTIKFRLRNTGKGPGAASEVLPLFTGGGFNAKYNDKYEPKTVDIPADAKRVEILVDVSGHGFGKDKANCAEFCNHTHHFTVKSSEAGEKTWVRDQPYVGDNFGCAKQIPLGVVPNQFGTWTLGRGGWCPGQEIPTTTFDVTSHAKAGTKVTISYEGMLGGKPYVPEPYNSPNGGFGGRVDLKSWLLIYK